MSDKCCYIDDSKARSKLCGESAIGRWRVAAVSPTNPRLRAFMLVPLCKKHGMMRGRRRL